MFFFMRLKLLLPMNMILFGQMKRTVGSEFTTHNYIIRPLSYVAQVDRTSHS